MIVYVRINNGDGVDEYMGATYGGNVMKHRGRAIGRLVMRYVLLVNPDGVLACPLQFVCKLKYDCVCLGAVTDREFHTVSVMQAVYQNGIGSCCGDGERVGHTNLAFSRFRDGIKAISAVHDVVYRTVGRITSRYGNE